MVPPERALTTNPRWEFDLHASGTGQVHRVVIVESAEAHRDLLEVGDHPVAGEPMLDMATHVMGEVAVASPEEER